MPQLKNFLNLLYRPDEIIELRFIADSKKPVENFVKMNGNTDNVIANYVKQYNSDYNCYFGVMPRTRAGEKKEISRVNACFLDIDKKDFLNPEYKKRWKEIEKILNKEENSELREERCQLEKKAEEKFLSHIKRIENQGFPAVNLTPSFKIFSGYGLHYYFILSPNETFEVYNNGKGQECSQWKEIQTALIELFRGDTAIKDLPRIMRIPNSFNVKSGDKRECKILNCNPEKLYRRNDFLPLLKKHKDYKDRQDKEKQAYREYKQELTQRNPEEFEEVILEILQEYGTGLFSNNRDYIKFLYACKSKDISYEKIDCILQKSDNYDYDRNMKDYEKLEPSKTTFGTAYYYAKQANEEELRKRLSTKLQFATPQISCMPPAHGACPGEKKKPRKKLLSPFSAYELGNRDLPELNFIVHDILPEGLTILAGQPKLGKSWLALNIACQVSGGEKGLNFYVTQKSDVLYIALEDGERRLQDRIQSIQREKGFPKNLYFSLKFNSLPEGGMEELEEFLTENENIKLVIIDTFQKCKGRPSFKGNAYETDYETTSKLQKLATEKHVSILLIHHLTKQKTSDFLENVSGSMGITGACDTVMVLKRARSETEAVLNITGRDVKEQELALSFDENGVWQVLGDAKIYNFSEARKSILELLEKSEKPMNSREIAEELNKNKSTVKNLLAKLGKENIVTLLKGKGYILTTDYTVNNNNNNNNNSSSSSDKSVVPVVPVVPCSPCSPCSPTEKDYSQGLRDYGSDKSVVPVQPLALQGKEASGTTGTTGTTETILNCSLEEKTCINCLHKKQGRGTSQICTVSNRVIKDILKDTCRFFEEEMDIEEGVF